jgi:hypothetical protein
VKEEAVANVRNLIIRTGMSITAQSMKEAPLTGVMELH